MHDEAVEPDDVAGDPVDPAAQLVYLGGQVTSGNAAGIVPTVTRRIRREIADMLVTRAERPLVRLILSGLDTRTSRSRHSQCRSLPKIQTRSGLSASESMHPFRGSTYYNHSAEALS